MNPVVTTPKRYAISRVVGHLAGMMSHIKWMKSVMVADMTAGDGCLDDESTANTILSAGKFLKARGKKVDIILNDLDPDMVADLKTLGSNVIVTMKDYADAVRLFSRRRYNGGIVLIDPYGVVGNLDKIAESSAAMPRVDFIFSVGAAGCKRAAVAYDKATRTSDIRNAIPKKHWHVLSPISKHQWTLLVGSSADSIRSIDSIGFHSVDSAKGAEICDIIDNTAKERSC